MTQAKHSIAAMVAAGFTSERGVRFWEEKGLLGPVERTAGDVRRYTDAQLGMATIIAAAKFGGWSLDDIAGMLKGWDAEAYEAIVVRLRDQARAAIRLAESLPMPPKRADAPAAVEYDL